MEYKTGLIVFVCLSRLLRIVFIAPVRVVSVVEAASNRAAERFCHRNGDLLTVYQSMERIVQIRMRHFAGVLRIVVDGTYIDQGVPGIEEIDLRGAFRPERMRERGLSGAAQLPYRHFRLPHRPDPDIHIRKSSCQ